jgi:uncharacterized protein
MITLNQQLVNISSEQPYPLLFTTISGAHLYGFPSPDSDYDRRGKNALNDLLVRLRMNLNS